jgi:phospholipase/carboxylesterase
VAGVPLGGADGVAVLVHGRGQDPGYLLEHLVGRLDAPGVAFVLPAAAGAGWYPDRFNGPRAANEPWLGHAVESIIAAVETVLAAGIPPSRLLLGGFSQGGCLITEVVARRPDAYGAVAVLTGALIGPPGDVTALPPLPGLRVHVATGRFDDWVPLAAVEATARAFEAAGARVVLDISDEPGHRITDGAVAGVQALVRGVAETADP